MKKIIKTIAVLALAITFVFTFDPLEAKAADRSKDKVCLYTESGNKLTTVNQNEPYVRIWAETNGVVTIQSNLLTEGAEVVGSGFFQGATFRTVSLKDQSDLANAYINGDGTVSCSNVENLYMHFATVYAGLPGQNDAKLYKHMWVTINTSQKSEDTFWDTIQRVVFDIFNKTGNYSFGILKLAEETSFEQAPPLDLTDTTCDGIFENSFGKILIQTLGFIRYLIPAILIILTVIDYIKALASQDQDTIKKVSVRFMKRMIIAIVIFIVPSLLIFLLNFVTDAACIL